MVSHCSLFSPSLLGGDLVTCLLMQLIKHKSGAFKRQQAARLQALIPKPNNITCRPNACSRWSKTSYYLINLLTRVSFIAPIICLYKI
ncbi:hypothetical protein P20652_3830 [Pseudoalteromonas sp. BSi20652]|nr:hypothetical protein P20652_3830 [Pseudoalteromonas sp. BSi20652]